jgi:hypothetical protein
MFTFPDIKFPTIDLSKFELPTIDLSKIDFPKIDLPGVDTSKLTDAVRDAAYVVVGLGATLVERARDLLDNAA